MRRVMNGLLRVASWWKVGLAVAVCLLLNLPGEESQAVSRHEEMVHGMPFTYLVRQMPDDTPEPVKAWRHWRFWEDIREVNVLPLGGDVVISVALAFAVALVLTKIVQGCFRRQYRLTSLLGLVAMAAFVMGLLKHGYTTVQRQEAALLALEQAGADCYFEYGGPLWLRQLVSNDSWLAEPFEINGRLLYPNERFDAAWIDDWLPRKNLNVDIDPEVKNPRETLAILGQLPNITGLGLYSDGIRGTDLASALQPSYSSLIYLSVSSCNQPATDFFVPLKNCRALGALNLYLDDTTPEHYQQIGACSALESLIISDPSFGNEDLASLAKLSRLRDLSFRNCAVSGPGLRILQNLPIESLAYNNHESNEHSFIRDCTHLKQLKRLSISASDWPDDQFHWFSGQQNLEELYLPWGGYGDKGLMALTDLPKLRKLILGRCRVSDAGIVHLQSFPLLETLSVWSGELSGKGFATLSGLRQLAINCKNWTGKECEQLLPLVELESLNLISTKVGDTGLRFLARLPKLRRLNVSGESVTIEGLLQLKACKSLQVLWPDEVDLTPAEEARLKKELPDVIYDPNWRSEFFD